MGCECVSRGKRGGPTSNKARKGESQLGGNVVKKMVRPFTGRDHVVVMDNFFTRVSLFDSLVGWIYSPQER